MRDAVCWFVPGHLMLRLRAHEVDEHHQRSDSSEKQKTGNQSVVHIHALLGSALRTDWNEIVRRAPLKSAHFMPLVRRPGTQTRCILTKSCSLNLLCLDLEHRLHPQRRQIARLFELVPPAAKSRDQRRLADIGFALLKRFAWSEHRTLLRLGLFDRLLTDLSSARVHARLHLTFKVDELRGRELEAVPDDANI